MLDNIRRNRDLVRRAAMLFAGELSFADQTKAFCEMLGETLDARVHLALGEAGRFLRVASGGNELGSVPPSLDVPIVVGGHAMGSLQLWERSAIATLKPDDAQVVETCVGYLAARIHDEVANTGPEHLVRGAFADALTGCASRRAFDERLAVEWGRAQRNGTALSLIVLDIDRFKAVNDTYGQEAGDECLRKVVQAARGTLRRPADFFARFGGEEFVALLPETDVVGAASVAEAMRVAVGRQHMSFEEASPRNVTISLGLAARLPRDFADASDLVAAAERALLVAKNTGRNRAIAESALSNASEAGPGQRGNLPLSRGRFVGQVRLLAALANALDRQRLVTITGPAGVGKTRVAVELARQSRPEFEHGTWFVDLSSVERGSGIVAHVAAALAVLGPTGQSIESLSAVVADKSLLLILDNCEHVLLETAAFVRELLALAPAVIIVTTSREPLGVQGEFVRRMSSLELDDAIELFIDRAREVGGANAQEDRRALIGAIVAQLDAIPFAIELVAPQLAEVGAEELLERLDDRLSLLRSGNRHGPTLEALLDWSYFLLGAGERTVFRRLAIFQGGCTLEAATIVASSAELGEGEVVAAIERLVAKSLLMRDSSAGTDRYSMLATTAEYAKQQIVSPDELHEVQRRHSGYFVALARRFAATFGSMSTTQWQREVTAERFNVRSALQRLFALGEIARAADLLDGLRDWCWERGALYLADMRERIESASLQPGHDDGVRASLWLTMSALLRRTDPAKACEYAERAFELRRSDKNLARRADALRSVVATAVSARGEIAPEFEATLRSTIDELLEDGSTVRAAELLNDLGILLAQAADDERIEEALACFKRATGLLRGRGDGDRCARLLGNIAAIFSGLGRVDDAIEYSRLSIGLYESSEEPWMAARQSMNHGLYLMERGAHGDYDEARVALRSALEAAREFNDIVATLAGLDYFTQLAHRIGRHREAIRLAGFAAREHAGAARQARYAAMHEELLVALRRTVGDLVYRAEWQNGQKMTIGEAMYVAQAL